jgi:glycosyltransferase involved in cell wall biosynthesis
MSSPADIVYFALNRWDSMVQREQHLMLGLSRTRRILFIDPPLSYLTTLLGKIKGKRWAFRSRLHRIDDKLLVYTPPAFPPFSQYFPCLNALHICLLISLTRGLLDKLSFKDYIVGIGRPFLADVIRRLNPRLSYYDCSDEYAEFPGLKADTGMLREAEKELLRVVDLVFCSSEGLTKAKSRDNRNSFLLPNGVDRDLLRHRHAVMDAPPEMKKVRKPVIGYVGTIGEWFDFDTLISLAQNRTDWSFVLIGPLTSSHYSSLFQKASNIYWLGEKGFGELVRYMKYFDVCAIPFKVNEFTMKIYPTKFHQYLAAGKPVVSSPLPDLQAFKPWVDFYTDAKEMEEKIDRAIREDSEEKALERRTVASENTWGERVKSMIEILNTCLGRK